LTVSGKSNDGINIVGSSFAFTVSAGGTIFFSATPVSVNDPIKTGWARLESIGGRLTAAEIFQYVEDGRIETTAGVLQSQPVQFATIPADDDDSQEKFTAYAIANPSGEAISIKLAVVDENGAVVVDIVTITLGPGQQIARYLHEDLNRLKFRGSMVLRGQAGKTFVAVALVQNQRRFTVIPVIPEKAPNIPD